MIVEYPPNPILIIKAPILLLGLLREWVADPCRIGVGCGVKTLGVADSPVRSTGGVGLPSSRVGCEASEHRNPNP